MPPRNHKNWTKTPNVEYISSECYNNAEIFAQEQKQIFSAIWFSLTCVYLSIDSLKNGARHNINFGTLSAIHSLTVEFQNVYL